MNWFTNLSIRLKILSVAAMGILAFLAYFVYGFYNNEANIRQISTIERTDFPVLENINESNLAYAAVRETFIQALNQQNDELSVEAHNLAWHYKEVLGRIAEIDPRAAQQVEDLIHLVDTYPAEADALAQVAMSDNPSPQDIETQRQRVLALQAQYESMQRAFEQGRYEAFRNKLNVTREDSRDMQYVGLAVSILTFVLLSLIAWRVTRS